MTESNMKHNINHTFIQRTRRDTTEFITVGIVGKGRDRDRDRDRETERGWQG